VCSSHLLCRILALTDLVMFFRKQNILATTINMCPCRQNLGLVEAKNFVPYIWASGTKGASGTTRYFGSM
jgi:hypothetical protein